VNLALRITESDAELRDACRRLLDPEQLRQLGAACVVTKPFRLEDLANVLRRVTQGVLAGLLPAGGTSPCVSPGDNVHRGGADDDTHCNR
jgi:hypothetical protein